MKKCKSATSQAAGFSVLQYAMDFGFMVYKVDSQFHDILHPITFHRQVCDSVLPNQK